MPMDDKRGEDCEKAETWVPIDIKFPNRCKTCGKYLAKGMKAFGSKFGPISRRTHEATWVFRCLDCHSREMTSERTALTPILEEGGEGATLDDLWLGELKEAVEGKTSRSKAPKEEKVAKIPGKGNTLGWFFENALWGVS